MTHSLSGNSAVPQRHLSRALSGISAMSLLHLSREPVASQPWADGSGAVARSLSVVSFRSFLQESIQQTSTSGAAVPRLLGSVGRSSSKTKTKTLEALTHES